MAHDPQLGEVLELVRPITRRSTTLAPAKPASAPALRKFPPTHEKTAGWKVALAVVSATIVTWSAIYFLVTAALSLGSGS